MDRVQRLPHVWSAIYEENCLKQSGSVDDMCYEERVLYRLLSGMHASVNIHIALKAKTPKKGVQGREDWSADPSGGSRRTTGNTPGGYTATCTSRSWCCSGRCVRLRPRSA